MIRFKTFLSLVGLALILVAYNNCSEQGMVFNSKEPTYKALVDNDYTFTVEPEGQDESEGLPESDESDGQPEAADSEAEGNPDQGQSGSEAGAGHGHSPDQEPGSEEGRHDQVCRVKKLLAQQGHRLTVDESCSSLENTSNWCAIICHVPPGNPAAQHTIAVGLPAVDAHLSHHRRNGSEVGDHHGPCGEDNGSSEDQIQCEDDGDGDSDNNL